MFNDSMRSTIGFLFVLGFVLSGWNLEAAVSSPKTRSKKIIESEAGLNIPDIGIAVDAIYEKKLDQLIPGYKLLLVVVSNKSSAPILFNPKKDQWLIRDNLDRVRKGINHPKLISQKFWEGLPQRLKDEFEYPSLLREGQMARIDILFPASVELENFRELIWKSVFFKKEFRLHSSLESNEDIKTSITISPDAEPRRPTAIPRD